MSRVADRGRRFRHAAAAVSRPTPVPPDAPLPAVETGPAPRGPSPVLPLPRMAGTPALEMRGVRLRVGDRDLLDVPDLRLAPGEILALVGPNGVGKSTLLQVAALLRRPDAGEMLICGEVATRRSTPRLRRRLALVFQDPLLFDVGVLANVASGLRFRRVGRQEAERTATAWLDRFGVAHLAGRSVRTLSGGEAQRVSLARAFATGPEMLLLDEPFAALDPPTRAALVPDLAAQLRATGTAAIIVTHDQAEALSLGDRLGVLLGGRIAQLGAPADVVARPGTVAVASFLGVANLLPVRVVSVAGERVEVAPEQVEPLIVARAERGRGVRVGQRFTLALHAHHLALQRPGVAVPVTWNLLSGVVVIASFTPAGQEVTIDCGSGLRLVAAAPVLPDRAPWSAGQTVTVGFDAATAHLIDADTGH